MAVDIKNYERLKKAAADAKSEYDRAQGTLTTLMESLEEDYGCKTVEEAEEKLVELQDSLEKAELRYETELKQYKAKFGELLDAR